MVSISARLHKKPRSLLLHGSDREAGTASVDGVQNFSLLVEARALDSGAVAAPPFISVLRSSRYFTATMVSVGTCGWSTKLRGVQGPIQLTVTVSQLR